MKELSMTKEKMLRRLWCMCTVFLVLSSAFVCVQGATDQDYPLEVTVGGTTYLFATHTGSHTSGNWIELTGGSAIPLPSITLRYDGVDSVDYDKLGLVEIDTDTSFVGHTVLYPFNTHPVYVAGSDVGYRIWGSPSLDGSSVEVRLLKVNDPYDYEEAASDLYRGDNTLFESLIDNWEDRVTGGVFNGTGDYSGSFSSVAAGDYILLALDESGPTRLYAATFVEVLDGDLTASVPVSEVDEGDYLDIELSLSGGETGSHIFGGVMVRESAYSAFAELTSNGSIPGTVVTVNDALMIEGGGSGFSLFMGGLDGLDIDGATSFMSEVLDGDEYCIGFTTSTGSNSSTLSLNTDGLSEDDYILLLGVWDNSGDLGSGNRVLGFTWDTVYVDRPVFLPPIIPPPEVPTQEEFDAMSPEEQAETILGLDTEEAVLLLEDASSEDAALVMDNIERETAVTLLEALDMGDAVEILGLTDTGTVAEILSLSSTELAAEILTELEVNKAAQVLTGLGVETMGAVMEQVTGTGEVSAGALMMNTVDETLAGDVLLVLQPVTGAKVLREMAVHDLTSAAMGLEAAVKRQLETVDPVQKEAYRQKLKNTIENPELAVDDLVDLFLEIADLPETPSTVAEIFEILETSTVVEVVEVMVAEGGEEEVGLVFGFLGVDALQEIYSALSSATRAVIYPYLDTETTGDLPQLGEFTLTSLVVSEVVVEPGESVSVSAVVENIGDESDTTRVSVIVNGVEYDSEIITLEPDMSIGLEWSITETVEDAYNVMVLGETVVFTVEAPPTPAEFTLSNLEVSPVSVQAGENVTVSFTVENIGELTGDYSVELMLDDMLVESLTGSLDGGESTSVVATVTSEAEGTHTVRVDGLEADFSVEIPPSGFPMTIITVVVAIVVFAAVGYMYLQRQR